MWVFLVIFVLGIAVGAYMMYKLMGWLASAPAATEKKLGGKQTTVTQSVTTYRNTATETQTLK